MEKNKKLVAISKDKTKVFIVKNVSEEEYNKLLNQENENDEKQFAKEEGFNDWSCNITDRIDKLEKKNLILAKSIYDNFVDRGLIENDDDFQQAWYDYYFNDKELEIEQYPVEFSKILEKVR